MTVKGTLYVRQLDESGNSIKWEISGDAQSRIDVVFSEWIVVEEMTQAPPFRRRYTRTPRVRELRCWRFKSRVAEAGYSARSEHPYLR